MHYELFRTIQDGTYHLAVFEGVTDVRAALDTLYSMPDVSVVGLVKGYMFLTAQQRENFGNVWTWDVINGWYPMESGVHPKVNPHDLADSFREKISETVLSMRFGISREDIRNAATSLVKSGHLEEEFVPRPKRLFEIPGFSVPKCTYCGSITGLKTDARDAAILKINPADIRFDTGIVMTCLRCNETFRSIEAVEYFRQIHEFKERYDAFSEATVKGASK